MGNDNHITSDREYFERATERARMNGASTTYDAIVFLEKEIVRYRDKIAENENFRNATAKKRVRRTNIRFTQENTVNEIIKALANNGYNTITINCYRDAESEG